jgi:hypothetical protein
MEGTAAMVGISVGMSRRKYKNTGPGRARGREEDEGVCGRADLEASSVAGGRAGASLGRNTNRAVDGSTWPNLISCASGSDHHLSSSLHPFKSPPWLNPSPSSSPPSKTIVPCPLLPTPHSTPPRTPAPSLAPPAHGALALSVTVIVTFPVHPPVNS